MGKKFIGKNWGQANKGNLMVDVYYRPPDLGEGVNEVFLFQLQGSDPDGGFQLL